MKNVQSLGYVGVFQVINSAVTFLGTFVLTVLFCLIIFNGIRKHLTKLKFNIGNLLCPFCDHSLALFVNFHHKILKSPLYHTQKSSYLSQFKEGKKNLERVSHYLKHLKHFKTWISVQYHQKRNLYTERMLCKNLYYSFPYPNKFISKQQCLCLPSNVSHLIT